MPPVVRPSLAIFGGLVGALLGSVVARVLMARALSPDELGLLFFALAAASALGGAASLGISSAGGRRIAELRAAGDDAGARRAARTAAALGVGCGTLAAAALLAAAPLLARRFGPPDGDLAALASALRAMAPIAWALPLGLAAVGISRGFGRAAGRSLIRDGGGGLLRAAAVAAAVGLGLGLLGVAAWFAAGVVAAEVLFLLWCASRGWLLRPPGPPASADRPLLAGLRPFATLEGLNQVNQWMDLLLLGALAPAAAVGFFGVARSVYRALEMTLRAPAHAFLPSATEAAGRGDEVLFGRVYRRTRLVALALLWLPLGISLWVPEVPVVLLAGAEYAPAAGLLRLLALVVLVSGLTAFMDLSLVARGREGAVALVQTGSVAAGLLLLLVLVPPFGAVGAAVALLGMELVRAAAVVALVVRTSPLRRLGDHLPGRLLGALALLAASGGVLLLAADGPVVVRTAVAAAGSAAGALLLAGGLVRKP
jgi:O-antigen/teichoic acid export membrane protein